MAGPPTPSRAAIGVVSVGFCERRVRGSAGRRLGGLPDRRRHERVPERQHLVAYADEARELGSLDVGQRDGATHHHGGHARRASRTGRRAAILHLDVVRFPITGPITYSVSAADAITLCDQMRPRVAVPVHYDGWAHFSEGEDQVRSTVDGAPTDVRARFLVLEPGAGVDLSGPAHPAQPL